MALISPTSGPYLGSYLPPKIAPALNLGLMRHGYLLEWQVFGHEVNKTTSWGRMTIEGIYLGADWRLASLALEFSSPGRAGGVTVTFLANNRFPPADGELDVVDATNWPARGTAFLLKLDGTTVTFTYAGKERRAVNNQAGAGFFWALTGLNVIAGAGGAFDVDAPVVLVTTFGGGPPDAAWPWNFSGVNFDAAPSPVGPKFAVSAGAVGRRWTDSSGAVLLTAVAGTPAAGSPATLTAPYAISNRRGKVNFDSTLRELPLDFQLLPYSGTQTNTATELSGLSESQGGDTVTVPPKDGVLNVVSTGGFAESGLLTVSGGGLVTQVSYSGKTEDTFTGVMGGAGSFGRDSVITQADNNPTRWWTST